MEVSTWTEAGGAGGNGMASTVDSAAGSPREVSDQKDPPPCPSALPFGP